MIGSGVSRWASAFPDLVDATPWAVTSTLPHILEQLLPQLSDEYRRDGDVAIHASARIESGAILKGPAIIGPGCFIAAGAYLRGGVWLERFCTIGPGSELKTVIAFAGTAAAHFNFIGDSILGEGVNLEAGAIVANFRNEGPTGPIRIRTEDGVIDTDVPKFGALIGDRCRIGANAVIAPGAVLRPATIVQRLALIDQGA